MDEVTTQASSVIDGLASTVSSVSGLSGGVSDSLTDIQSALTDAASALTRSAKKLDNLSSQLASITNGGTIDLSAISSAKPDAIASMLAAPVAVDRIALYPVANYGSAMAPFYTILSIWVGAIILVAMCNEGELLEKFNIQLSPIPMTELVQAVRDAQADEQAMAAMLAHIADSFEICIPEDKVPAVAGLAIAMKRLVEKYRSEERRVGKECTSWCRSRWSPYH